MNKSKAKSTIFAYGFDAIGLYPQQPLELEDLVIEFVGHEAAMSLEVADGIIMPSGIFEKIESNNNYGRISTWVTCDKDRLAKRDKEVNHSLKRGGWVAFLLGEVDNFDGKYDDTDLAKRFLNACFDHVRCTDPNPHIACKSDEFADYFHEFGISRTAFWHPDQRLDHRVLASIDEVGIVAAEAYGKIFFLPIPTIEGEKLVSLVSKCAEAVLKYRRRNDLYLPAWIEEIEFQSEHLLRAELTSLEEQITQRREELSKWRRYKGILSTSGRTLNALVVEILQDYFKLDVRSKEEFIEDAIIHAEGKPLFVVEIKGVSGGLKREHVNQVDTHRERRGLSNEIAGLLVINDFSDVDGLEQRKAKTFDALQLGHAEKMNVRILRTTRLLEIIRALEAETERGSKFIQLCLNAKPMVELPKVEKSST